MAAYVKDRLQCRSIGAVHQGLCTWPRSSMVIQSIHDILASDPLPVAVMVSWDPDFFLAYAHRGKGALHSSLALIGSDLLSFLQSVVLRCCLLSVSQEKLGLAQEKEVLLEDCHFTPQAQRSAWEWPRWPLFSTETTPSISTDTVRVYIFMYFHDMFHHLFWTVIDLSMFFVLPKY